MSDFFEMMKTADVVVGLITAIGSVAVGAIFWAVRVRSGVSAEISRSFIHDREKLEGVADRVGTLERRMETLAGVRELHELHVELAGMQAQMRETAGQVDTIYRAAIAAGAVGR